MLAVDGDLRKPSLAQEFGIPETLPGLAEVLLAHDEPSAYLVPTPIPSGTLLPGGRLGADFAVAHATSSSLPEVFARLRRGADVVLVDTAPVALAAETSIMTSVVDDVIVVVDARDLRREALEDTRDQLARAGANLLGIVINRTEVPEDRSLKSAYGRPYRTPEPRDALPAPPESGHHARSPAR